MDLLAGSRPPLGAAPSSFEDAADAFAGYLLLDAVVANTDRHHENWCLVQYDGGSHLAPCYDLGTCLDFQLTDTRRREAFETADRTRTITAWCQRGRSGTVEGRPPLVDVAVKAVRLASDGARAALRDRLAGLDEKRIADVLAGVPDDRMSQWAGSP